MRNALLKSVCNITMGQAPPGSSYNENREGLPLIAGAGDFGNIFPNPNRFTTEGSKISQRNDIILCIRATIGELNWSDRPYCLGRGVAGLRPFHEKLNQRYLWHWLGTMKQSLKGQARGSTFKQVNKETVENMTIPLPPLKEQKRIAAILDKADAIRRKRQESIRLTEEFLRSVFLDMFGDPVTNPKGWDVQSLEECCLEKAGIKAGPFGSALKKEFYTSSGYRIYGQEQVLGGSLGIGDYYIDRMKYASLKSCAVAKGDLLISLVGSIGQTLVVPEVFEPGIINPRLIRIRTDSEVLSTVYLQYVFKQECIKKMLAQKSHGGTMPVLNASMLKQLEFPIPPVGLQNKFIDIMEKSTRTISQIEVAFLTSANLFNSLVQRAFKGTVK